ncbi:MAG TPA: hypothetical protein VGR30_09780 [Candidatus Binatia bacterium]|jgi:hypothetical protein|nr:hypothetical protein [Candidatus Binatia bacterium]
MNKTLSFLSSVGILLLVAFNLYPQEQVPAPVYKDGEFWHFRAAEKDFLIQTTRAIGGDYEVFYSGGKVEVKALKEEEAKTREDIGHLRRMLNLPDDKWQLLQFPLAVGKKWSTSFQVTSRLRGALVNRNAETSVTGMEQITTPAGTFRAFKIERRDYTAGRTAGPRGGTAGGEIFSLTYYYSPDTRAIVKYYDERQEPDRIGTTIGKREIELIKFGSKLPN